MTEIEVTASIRARRPEAVGRTMTSVVPVLPGHVNKPQPQPHSCGAEDTSRTAGAGEEDGIGVSVDDAATVAGEEFRAAITTFFKDVVVDSARSEDPTVIKAVGCDRLATERDGRKRAARGVATVRFVMTLMTGPFNDPCTMYPSTIDKIANLYVYQYAITQRSILRHSHGESVRRHLRRGILNRSWEQRTEGLRNLVCGRFLQSLLFNDGRLVLTKGCQLNE